MLNGCPKRRQDQLHGCVPSVAQGQGAQPDDVISGAPLPSGAGAFHPHLERTLAGGLAGATTNRATLLSRCGIVHLVPMILQVGDRVMDGTSLSDSDLSPS